MGILPLLTIEETREEIAAIDAQLLRLGTTVAVSLEAVVRIDERRDTLAWWRAQLEQQLADLERIPLPTPILETT